MIQPNQIIQGECVKVMSEHLPHESVDLTLTSPPYDDMRTYEGYSLDIRNIAAQLYRVTKRGGVVVWVVADQTKNHNMSLTSFKHALYMKYAGFNFYHHMIYRKGRVALGTPNGSYFNDFENMFVFTKGGKPKTYNAIEDVKNKHAGKSVAITYRNRDGTMGPVEHTDKVHAEYGKRGRVWHYNQGGASTTKDKFAYEHPAMFPEKLAHDHIITWSNEGDIVLDPFCGGGTTLKVAKQLNRKYMGIDVSEKYCKLSYRRVTEGAQHNAD